MSSTLKLKKITQTKTSLRHPPLNSVLKKCDNDFYHFQLGHNLCLFFFLLSLINFIDLLPY